MQSSKAKPKSLSRGLSDGYFKQHADQDEVPIAAASEKGFSPHKPSVPDSAKPSAPDSVMPPVSDFMDKVADDLKVQFL